MACLKFKVFSHTPNGTPRYNGVLTVSPLSGLQFFTLPGRTCPCTSSVGPVARVKSYKRLSLEIIK